MGNPKGIKRDSAQVCTTGTAAHEGRQTFRPRLEPGRRCPHGRRPPAIGQPLHKAWQEHGARSLKKAGRAGTQAPPDRRELPPIGPRPQGRPEAHDFGTLLWTTRRVATVIQRLTGVQYHEDHVCRLLQKLGWSCQRPTTQARQRNEQEIARWRKVRWPQLKKKPSGRAESWFSSTKAD